MSEDLLAYIHEARQQINEGDERGFADVKDKRIWERQKAVILGQIVFAQAVVDQAELTT